MQIQDRNGTHKRTSDPGSTARRTIAAGQRGMRDEQIAANADRADAAMIQIKGRERSRT
jgi:hypothetical protein